MSLIVEQLRTKPEKTYGVLLLAAGVILWLVIAYFIGRPLFDADASAADRSRSIIYIVEGLLIWAFFAISAAAYRAHAFGNMVLLGPQQFPELWAMVTDAAGEIGMKEPPRTFIYNSNGLINAFARRIFAGRYVFLTSALLEANDDEQVRFVIGHELGHHAAGHLDRWIVFLHLPGLMVPFLYPAYSRGRELTCDRIGAHVAKNVTVCHTSLMMLGCGCRRLNTRMNCDAFMAQEAQVPPLFGFLTEIMRSHPRLTRRLLALRGKGT